MNGAIKQFTDTEDWRKENAIDALYDNIDLESYEETRLMVGFSFSVPGCCMVVSQLIRICLLLISTPNGLAGEITAGSPSICSKSNTSPASAWPSSRPRSAPLARRTPTRSPRSPRGCSAYFRCMRTCSISCTRSARCSIARTQRPQSWSRIISSTSVVSV